MMMSVAFLLWLDLCVLMARVWVDGLKDTILLPNLLYLVGRKLIFFFFFVAVENLSFQLTFPMLNNIVDNIRVDSIPLHSDYSYRVGETVEVLGILGVDVLQHNKPYSHEELWVHNKRANFIELPNGHIPFGSAEQFLVASKSKIPCSRLVERSVPWDDESSLNNNKIKRMKLGRGTGVSDAAKKDDVKKHFRDVKKQNLQFTPQKE